MSRILILGGTAKASLVLEGLVVAQGHAVTAAGACGGDPARAYTGDRDAAIRAGDAATASGVQSGLQRTILGPGALNFDEPTGRSELDPYGGEVSRAHVADVIASSLADNSTFGRTIRSSYGNVPIAEAISTRA